MAAMDIGNSATGVSPLRVAADRLRCQISAAKNRLGQVNFEWYPYDTLSNVEPLARLLVDSEPAVLEAASRDGVLDVGCQDGEMSFLFESLGCRVTAIDNAATNHNGLRGISTLISEFGSSVQLHHMDLNLPFSLPQQKYGLALLLGVLYHLRNPFQVMDQLAQHATYCICSTRVMRRLPDGSTIPAHFPVAYLLDAYELNEDDSNYWIFSESAFERMLSRTVWGVCAFLTVGDREASDPVSLEHDERAFCLLRRGYAMSHLQLIDGWHEAELTGWRWTKREFSLGLPAGRCRRITMRLFIPPTVLERLGVLTLRASLDGTELRQAVLDKPGEHVYTRLLNAHDGSSDRVIHFQLDKALAAGVQEDRELGVVVSSVELS